MQPACVSVHEETFNGFRSSALALVCWTSREIVALVLSPCLSFLVTACSVCVCVYAGATAATASISAAAAAVCVCVHQKNIPLLLPILLPPGLLHNKRLHTHTHTRICKTTAAHEQLVALVEMQ